MLAQRLGRATRRGRPSSALRRHAKKAICLPSGDQKGTAAAFAAGHRREVEGVERPDEQSGHLSGKEQREGDLPPVRRDGDRLRQRNLAFSGRASSNRTGRAFVGSVPRRTSATRWRSSAAAATTAAIHGVRPADAARPGPSRAAHARACFSSRTDCQRSAGSLARQVTTTCSRAGGVAASSAEIGTGSLSRIAAITLAALLASKACWPVSIS